MVKIHHFQISVQEYYRRGKENLFPDLYGCPNPCCHYEGRLRRHGFYTRHALTLLAAYVIVIQRYYCPVCKKTASLLPSFLAPRFQYSLACIFFALYQRTVRHLTFARAAEKINLHSGRSELSYQHVRFYFRRLLANRPLLTGFFGSRGVVFAEPDPLSWSKAFVALVYCQLCFQSPCHRVNVCNLGEVREWVFAPTFQSPCHRVNVCNHAGVFHCYTADYLRYNTGVHLCPLLGHF